jgi:two-component system, NtrC family, response regulator AtoC
MNLDSTGRELQAANYKPYVLIVDDDELIRGLCSEIVHNCEMSVKAAGTTEEAIDFLSREQFDLVVTDIRVPSLGGLELIKRIHALAQETGVVVLTGHGTIDMAVEAIYSGVLDYITKPFTIDIFEQRIRKAAAVAECNRSRQSVHKTASPTEKLIGKTPAIKQLRSKILKISSHDYPVLILGETGTGKEVVARAIHCSGSRASGPFVPVDCGALTPTLIESELFGHERGAFTGAIHTKIGLFEAAHMGTLFLDEVGDLPKELQSKLLRVLQEREIRRIGSTAFKQVDIRVIAATNRDLEAEVKAGTFREDLFYRLNVMQITLAPLRERMADLPLLVSAFLKKFGGDATRDSRISPNVWPRLSGHHWPGNVRELENVIERGLALGSGSVLNEDDVLVGPQREDATTSTLAEDTLCLDAIVRKTILRALRETKGDKLTAAQLLGIGKTTLYRKLKQYASSQSKLQARENL